MSFAEAIHIPRSSGKLAEWIAVGGRAVHSLLQKLKPAGLNPESGLVIEGRLALGPKKSLVVVSCRGEHFLVASGGDSITAVLPLRQKQRSRASALARRGRRAR